jgi:hypothetical protein
MADQSKWRKRLPLVVVIAPIVAILAITAFTYFTS